MTATVKAVIILLIILLAACLLYGQAPVIFTGKIVLPGSEGERQYLIKGTATITPDKIEITSVKKIFRLFNDFGTRRKHKLTIATSDVYQLDFDDKHLIIYPTTTLYQRYRNIFSLLCDSMGNYIMQTYVREYKVIFFILDNPQAAKAAGASMVKSINDQSDRLSQKHSRSGTGQIVTY